MKLHTETLCIQAGYSPKSGEPRQIPIVQSTTFKYATSEEMGKLFDLEAEGYFYSRLQNPTCDAVLSPSGETKARLSSFRMTTAEKTATAVKAPVLCGCSGSAIDPAC